LERGTNEWKRFTGEPIRSGPEGRVRRSEPQRRSDVGARCPVQLHMVPLVYTK
jgi:hypothetical protein